MTKHLILVLVLVLIAQALEIKVNNMTLINQQPKLLKTV